MQTAARSEEEAHRLATAILESRLAACVQVVGPVTSRDWWQGYLEPATEWLCLAKTTDDLVEDIVAAIRTAHSYDTPEIIVLPIVGGDDAYLRWISETVKAVEPTVSIRVEGP